MKKGSDIPAEFQFLFVHRLERDRCQFYLTKCKKISTAIRRFLKRFPTPDLTWRIDHEVMILNKYGNPCDVKHPYIDISDEPLLDPYK